MKSILRTILLWALRKLSEPASDSHDRLICDECGAPIRKRDRYVILTCRHRDCRDPRLIEELGQIQLKIEGGTTDEQG